MFRIRATLAAMFLALAVLVAGPSQASSPSPIFGSAEVTTMSHADAAQVTAKGYYADLYGSYAVNDAYYAYLYAFYARYYAGSNSYNEYNWYWTAANYAYSAYIYAYYAGLYSYYGY